MSAKWTFWAWEQDIKTAPKKLALLQLANNANDDGKSWYSITKMANACGVGERTFQRQIQALEEDGLLHVERRSNRPSIYTLTDEVEITLHRVSGCQSDGVGCQSDGAEGVTESPDLNSNPNTYPDTKRSLVPAEPKRSKFKFTPEDMQCAEWMRERIVMVNPSAPRANLDSWANTVRLMREMDEKTHWEILEVFKWANLDSFWCNNIQSPEKLRKQFGNLQGRMRNAANQPAANAEGNRKLSAAEENEERLRKLYGNNSMEGNATSCDGVYSSSNAGHVQQQPMETHEATIELGADDWRTVG